MTNKEAVSYAVRYRDLSNCEKVKGKLAAMRDWLHETGHIDIIGRIIKGSGIKISTLLSTASSVEINDVATYKEQISLGSYNYSGLATDVRVIQANIDALHQYGVTMSGVRLLNGTTDMHYLFEEKLSSFIGAEDCVTYASGLAANISVISCFCSKDDVILSDYLNHQSIYEGIKLSGAQLIMYPHSDMHYLEAQLIKLGHARRKIIITDSIFSMDGDIAKLKEIIALAEKYNAFIILDEAHSIGGYGPNLRGVAAEMDVVSKIDIITGSLNKGLPGVGGFALGNHKAMEALRFTSNGYIFSASLPPSTLAGLIKAIEILSEDDSIEKKQHANQKYLRAELRSLGLNVPEGETAIIPIIFEDEHLTFSLARELHNEGIFVNAIKFPAVPKNAPRIRLNITASLTDEDLQYAIKVFKKILIEKRLGTPSLK